MQRFVYVVVLVCTVATGSLPAAAEAENLAAAVRARNAELAALGARSAEARARIGPAGALPDPRVEIEVMDAMNFGGPRAAVRQMLPIAGQPALMARMAALDVDMLDAERADRELMLLADGVRAVTELSYLSRIDALTTTMRELTGQMARVAEAKYATGKGMQADVLRAHVARTKLLALPIGYEARRRTAKAQLEAIAPGWTPPASDLTLGPALPVLDKLIERARRESPMLRMRRLAIAESESGLELARADRLPDIDLGIMAGRSMPGDMPYLGGMAMATLPLWYGSKQGQRIEAAEHRVAARRAALLASERDVMARLETAHAQTIAAERQLAIYRGGLIIQTKQAFRSALSAYQVDRSDFLMMLDALMALYDVQMSEAMALAERHQMAAMTLALAGADPTNVRTVP